LGLGAWQLQPPRRPGRNNALRNYTHVELTAEGRLPDDVALQLFDTVAALAECLVPMKAAVSESSDPGDIT
jgi:hypothetical protein